MSYYFTESDTEFLNMSYNFTDSDTESRMSILAELGTRNFLSFASTTTRQRNRAVGTRQNAKTILVSVSEWSSHNKYSKIAIKNTFVT